MTIVARRLVLSFLFGISSAAAAETSCECPKLACDPCSFEKGITFFTEKCGPSDSKVKSCARPTCIPIDTATAACPNPPKADSGPREPIVVAKPAPPTSEAADGADEAPTAGKVKVLQGSVSIVHADGKKTVVSKEAELRQGDRVESGKDHGAFVEFKGGNKLHIHPETTVEVKEYSNPESPEARRALLNLVKGKVRSQVKQKYDGKSSYYRVITRGAVAGVRGTDFLVAHSEDAKLETRVETLHGKVVLETLDASAKRTLQRGEGAVFTSDLKAEGGALSEVYKIAPDSLRDLDRDSRMDIARAKSAPVRETEICDKPKGFFNQCSWRCDGNRPGEKSCRTDEPGVRCLRARCNGNGVWAEETALPAALGRSTCPAQGISVKDCDY